MTGTAVLERRAHLFNALNRLAEATPADLAERLDTLYVPGAEWRGSHPINGARGVDGIAATVWSPLIKSFPES